MMGSQQKTVNSNEKRKDLQGIRGIAILFVLLMHLKPNIFRIGFIGVDMFFVLSGFLMTKILREKPLSAYTTFVFYVRRFKRIIPLYMFIVVAITIHGYLFLVYSFRWDLTSDLTWACAFISNLQPYFQKMDYWRQLSTYGFFVHLWSLAVECQYYLIVPLIICPTSHCESKTRIICFTVLCLISISFQLLTPPEISYGFLPSRVWQFMCGSTTYELTRMGSMYERIKFHRCAAVKNKWFMISNSISLIVISLVLLVIFSPQFIGDHAARCFATISVGVIIFFESDSSLLTNKLLTYFGDISYILYLVHWPIIVATKYHTDREDLSLTTIVGVVIVCFAVSIAIHHTIEKFFMENGAMPALLFIIGCYFLILGVLPGLNEKPTLDDNLLSNVSKDYSIKWNSLESRKFYIEVPCREDLETSNYTHYVEEPQCRCVDEGIGRAKILLIGNSVAYRAYPLIHNILHKRYKTFRLMAKSSCPALSNRCPHFTEAVRKVVKHEKPDILINIHHSVYKDFVDPIEDLKTDRIFREFQSSINFFSIYSKHIVIDMPYYHFWVNVGEILAKRISQNHPLGDELVVTWDQYLNQTRYHRERISSINCKKCIINDVTKVLFQNKRFYSYDPETLLARLSDGYHMSPVGLEMLRPLYTEILDKLVNDFAY
ncbi:acyltransferase [Dictyocaulus viviparus]|uniref:Acyltransferase n=1 Tax=Dictyocaulus viviparus TaxID=29172 RepID=A0A0D8XJQ3_DICVI|nr:acyltransferase [Dictyocaulus viviparus]